MTTVRKTEVETKAQLKGFVVPFGAKLPIWVLLYLLQRSSIRAGRLSPDRGAVRFAAGDQDDWRLSLQDVQPPHNDTARAAEAELRMLFLGINDGDGTAYLHARKGPDGTLKPPPIFPDPKDVWDKVRPELTTDELRLFDWLMQVSHLPPTPDPAGGVSEPTLASIIDSLEWARHQGELSTEQVAEAVHELVCLAHDRVRVGEVKELGDLFLSSLLAWRAEWNLQQLAADVHGHITKANQVREVDEAEAAIDLAAARRATVVRAGVPILILDGRSKTRYFTRLAFQADGESARVVIQQTKPGFFLVSARLVDLRPIVAQWRLRVANKQATDGEKVALSTTGRPLIGGERTPVLLAADSHTAGNVSAQNPYLREVMISRDDLQQLVVQVLGATP